MKERVSSEINSSMSKGKEYAGKTVKSAAFLAESIAGTYWGEAKWELNGNVWTPRTVKPGIRHLLRIRR